MMKAAFLVLLTSLTLYYSSLALASDEHGRYWIYGVGRQTCSTYLESRKSGGISEISYKNWISGYLTSSNRSSDDTYNLLGNTDFHGALVWLDRYCKKSPKNTVYMGMANLTAVMYPKRRKSK
jgi:hypothetical protein